MQSIADVVNAVAPTTNPMYTPLIGDVSGTSNPAPVILAGGYSGVSVVDWAEHYAYTIDGSGNLLRGLITQTPTQILAASAFGSGATIQYMTMFDSTTIYAATNNHTVLAISTTAPYTVTTLAGVNGTSGSADGTGAAATFGAIAGLSIDPVAGGFLVAWDNTTGNIRKITTAGVVTTLANGVGAISAQGGIQLDTAGNVWFTFPGYLVYRNIYTGNQHGSPGGGAGYSGSYIFPVAVDYYQPASAYIYSFGGAVSGGTALLRQPTGADSPILTVATTAHQVNNNGNPLVSMCMRPGGLYFVDSSQNLTRIGG